MRSCLKIIAPLVVVLAIAACSEGPDSTFDSSSSETSVLGPNLTLVDPACLGDLVWVDTNGNGCQDAGEEGLGGVKLEAIRCSDGAVLDETTSEADGYYGLYVPGDGGTYYRVRVTFPDGYTATITDADCGTDSYKKDNDVESDGETFCTYLVDGRIKKYIDIGLVPGDTPPDPKKVCLGDRVWLDTDCDGIQDGGEAGVKNVTVNLYTCAGAFLASTTTDANGNYEFCNLDEGSYKVGFVAPSGHTFSPQNVGADDAVDSDAGADGMTGCVTLTDKDDDTVDAGLCEEKKLVCLGDLVWLDEDCDGIQDGNESGVKDVLDNLYVCGGQTPIASTTTNANGYYEFCELESGDYCVEFIAPDGHYFSPQNVGTDDEVDSDADSKGKTACVTLDDKDDDTVDAGLCEEKKGGEGCTPGYWKNHTFAWVGYTPGQLYDTVFGVTLFPGMTLLEVLMQGGGDETYERIGRHSVAALLGAAHPGVETGATVQDIKDMVADAIADPSKVHMIGDMLEDLNTQGCPLSGRDPGLSTGGDR